jgi:hypothetical protein
VVRLDSGGLACSRKGVLHRFAQAKQDEGIPTVVRQLLLRCQMLGGAIHGDFIVVRTFARNAQQNRDREA